MDHYDDMAAQRPEKPPPANASITKFSSVLKSPIDRGNLYPETVNKCLVKCLKDESPDIERIVRSVVMPRFDHYKYPDAKVIQVEIEEMGIMDRLKSRRFVKKLWETLIEEQKSTMNQGKNVRQSKSFIQGEYKDLMMEEKFQDYHMASQNLFWN